jgi:uncharacterized protein YkwD
MSQFNVRHAWIAVVAAVAVVLPASSASARLVPTQLPCLPGLTCPAEDPSVSACANEGLVPAVGNLRKVRRATLCLLNRERTSRDLVALRGNRKLRRAATRYARQMVAQDFFAHVSPTGSTFIERIRATDYLDNANGYDVGENLAWGGGSQSTPREIVASWMLSQGHRANILKPAYREIGVGIALGVPLVDGGSGATYVNEFGRRG